ncbi:ParB/RepB/Spo0J family partition protein [Pseudomonas sp. GXZC]|uniref:ParB/RepB/Spo0J family partition protein n=1 Tax=Pseudomonas sp. GXZC TaxID=3003351 RepID=UPI0022AB271C|nr:ParB/RepB/Spo0J family partition protein [Pseudomonas sp. GXZC]WAT32118.1 ParB/RepB/Spo0J family partition protein [Pseudomonas sp. GXZC]
MAKQVRPLGKDRNIPEQGPAAAAPAHIQGVRAPAVLPDKNLDVSLDDILARRGLLDDEPSNAPGASSRNATASTITPASTESDEIPIILIDPSPYQPRLSIDEVELDLLAVSISEAGGLRRPIILRKKSDGRYELVGGERRWRAHFLLGWETIRARVCELSDAEAEIEALADNYGEAGLSDFEAGKAYRRIMDNNQKLTASALARRVGVNQSTVSRCLGFLSLPESIQDYLKKKPRLIGTKNVLKFVELSKRDEGVVLQAVASMSEGKLAQQGAIRWILDKLNAGKEPPRTEPRALYSKARPIGTIKVVKGKIEVSCDHEADAERIASLVAEFLQTVDGI